MHEASAGFFVVHGYVQASTPWVAAARAAR